jgi:predicted CopG family antitoxin
MAVKTITIDLEAYEKLSREKREGESFSQVIKRILASRNRTARALLQALEGVSLSDQTLDSITRVVQSRENDLIRAPGALRPDAARSGNR